ncbi:MAG: transcriptional regulator [Treponema sp. CETP13]|nr:MAG: transcriptional regulator [Treponema sp. CETP13]
MNSSEKIEDTQMNELIDEGLKELLRLVYEIDDPKLLEDFFRCLFTPAELVDISKRWLLVKEIEKGTTQREIAKKYRLSLCKITRGSKELKKDYSAFRKLLDRI